MKLKKLITKGLLDFMSWIGILGIVQISIATGDGVLQVGIILFLTIILAYLKIIAETVLEIYKGLKDEN